jgi:GNAT superfamily N-acetyltransferase
VPTTNHPAPQILPATETDLPAVARLAGVIWRAHYPGLISSEQIEYMLAKMYAIDILREEIRLRSIRYERLLMDQELGGFASHGPTEQPKLFKLHKIYLHPAWQGRGLGSLLLRHCEREACKLGADRLMLTVNKRNSKAIAAYERNGFAITDAVVADIGGGFVMDDYVMSKVLKT